jgi:hypothetical protein
MFWRMRSSSLLCLPFGYLGQWHCPLRRDIEGKHVERAAIVYTMPLCVQCLCAVLSGKSEISYRNRHLLSIFEIPQVKSLMWQSLELTVLAAEHSCSTFSQR